MGSVGRPGAGATGESGAIERWDELVRRRREQFERLRGEPRKSTDDTYWRRRAGNYYEAERARLDAQGPSAVVRASLDACAAAERAHAAAGDGGAAQAGSVPEGAPGSRATVLDVGGGFGAAAVPIARSGRAVTVVEPSAAMREYLGRWVADESVGSLVRVVAADWMSAAVGRHDVVLCANVLYPIEPVAPFVRKLLAATGYRCLIAMRANVSEIAPPDLFVELHGEERIRQPTFDDLRGVLLELGLRFDEEVIPVERDWSYASLDEAEEALSETLLVADSPELRRRVREWAAATLVEQEGRLLAPRSGPVLEGIASTPRPRA